MILFAYYLFSSLNVSSVDQHVHSVAQQSASREHVTIPHEVNEKLANRHDKQLEESRWRYSQKANTQNGKRRGAMSCLVVCNDVHGKLLFFLVSPLAHLSQQSPLFWRLHFSQAVRDLSEFERQKR